MILVTGAGGRTGRAVIADLVGRGEQVRAFIRTPSHEEPLRALGAAEVVLGDLDDAASLMPAAAGCRVVVHIGPPMHPREVEHTDAMLAASRAADVERFVYYSVMHPFRRDVRHHALKLDATEHVVESGLTYTVVEPCRYMQHLEPIWARVRDEGVHAMPFSTQVRFSVVDLLDLAEAVGCVVTQDGHEYATYELAGPQPLSQDEMARIIGEVLGRDVRAEQVPLEAMAAAAAAKGFGEDRIEQMQRMNAHYDQYGFPGNPNVLQWLIGRPATPFEEYVRRLAATAR